MFHSSICPFCFSLVRQFSTVIRSSALYLELKKKRSVNVEKETLLFPHLVTIHTIRILLDIPMATLYADPGKDGDKAAQRKKKKQAQELKRDISMVCRN